MALITQSVDSRNHVIVAGGVTAGLIAALLRFAWLDYLVGLAVAVLILKSAVELVIELIRSRNEDTPNLSKFQFGFYERFRRSQLCSYMLFLVRNHEAETKDRLLSSVRRAFDFKGNILLQSMGVERFEGSDELIHFCYERLIQRKFLTEGPRLELTSAGERKLASNRFFLSDEQQIGFMGNLGSWLRIGFSLLVRWSVFFTVYWLATAYLLPRLPALPLWNSIDFYLLTVGSFQLSLFNLLHLAVGFALVTHAALRMSLIFQRHLSIRERRGKKYTKLQTNGFYSRVRHPMAATTLLFNLGLFFAFRTAWAIVPFAVVVVATILSGIIEERKELRKRFGREYEEYESEVPRRYLTPFLALYLGISAAAYVAGLIL